MVVENTDNHGYKKQDKGDTDWHIPLNETMDKLDVDVLLRGKKADRSNAGEEGRVYLSTDTSELYYDNGSSWVRVLTKKLQGLDDVSTSSLSDGEALVYNGSNFVNIDITTESELSSHENDSSAHHERPSAGDALSEDASNNFNLSQSLSSDGVEKIVGATDINFTDSNDADVTVTDDGDGTATVEVDVDDTDTRTGVSEDGSQVLSGVSDINFTDSNDASVTVTDDSDGTVSVDVDVSNPSVSDSGSNVLSSPSDINFDSDFSVVDDTDGTVSVSLSSNSLTVAGNSVSLGGSTSVSVDDLSDANTGSESAGETLLWDENNTEFVNASISSGNGLSSTSGNGSYTVDLNEGSFISTDSSNNVQVDIDSGLTGDGSGNITLDESYGPTWTGSHVFNKSVELNDSALNITNTSDSKTFFVSYDEDFSISNIVSSKNGGEIIAKTTTSGGTRNDALRLKPTQNVEVPNGDLNIGNTALKILDGNSATSLNIQQSDQFGVSQIQDFKDSNTMEFKVTDSNSSLKTLLRLDPSGNGTVRIPNGSLSARGSGFVKIADEVGDAYPQIIFSDSSTDQFVTQYLGPSNKLIMKPVGGSSAFEILDNERVRIPSNDLSLNGNDLENISDIKSMDIKSSEPSSPGSGDVYIDDGTNTASGNLAIRVYDGSSWVDMN